MHKLWFYNLSKKTQRLFTMVLWLAKSKKTFLKVAWT